MIENDKLISIPFEGQCLPTIGQYGLTVSSITYADDVSRDENKKDGKDFSESDEEFMLEYANESDVDFSINPFL